MANNQITLEILTEIQKSVKALETLGADAAKQFSGIQKKAKDSFGGVEENARKTALTISDGFRLAIGAAVANFALLGGRKVLGVFEDGVKAASEETDALNELNTALQLTGIYSDKTAEDLATFVDGLEKSSKFTGEQVASSAALIQSLGRLSGEGLKQATQAAVDLSAALRIDLNTASQLVGKAATGNIEVFKRYGLEIKKGQNASESFANALKTLQDRFGGAAAAQLNTYSGAVFQLETAYQDVLKVFGRAIVQNPSVIAGIRSLTSFIQILGQSFQDNKGFIEDFISSMVKLGVKVIPSLITPFQILIGLINGFTDILTRAVEGNIQILGGLASFIDKDLGNSLTGIAESLKESRKLGEEFSGNVISALEQSRKGVQDTADGFDKLTSTIKNAKPAIKATGKAIEDNLDTTAADALKGSFDKLKSSIADITKENDKLTKSKSEQIDAALQGSIELATNAVKELAAQGLLSDAAKEQISLFLKLNEEKAKLARGDVSFFDLNLSEASNFISEAFNSVSQGVSSIFDQFASGDIFGGLETILTKLEGVAQLIGEEFSKLTVGDIASGIGNVLSGAASVLSNVLNGGYLGQLSGFVDQIANAPAQFVDVAFKFKDALVGFIEGAPAILESITQALPSLLSSIAAALPDLVSALVPLFEQLASIIADQAPALAEGLLKAITKLVQAAPEIIKRLVAGIPALISAILRNLPALITAIFQAIPEIVRIFADSIPLIVQEFAANISPIILALTQGLIEVMPDITLALVDSLIVKGGIFKIVGALIAAMPDVGIALAQGFLRAIANVGASVFQYLAQIFSDNIKLPKLEKPDLRIEIPQEYIDILSGKALGEAIVDAFNKATEGLRKLDFTGGGGGLGGFTKKLGFADGGIVPKAIYAASGTFVPRGTDTVPAMLTPGELVIPTNDVDRLSRFLDQQAVGGGADTGLLGRLESIVARYERSTEKNVTVNVQVGEKSIAEVILSLNRQGFRTA